MAAKYAYHRYVSTSDEKEAALKFGPTPLASRLHPFEGGEGERWWEKYGRANMRVSVCNAVTNSTEIFAHGEKQANSAPGIVEVIKGLLAGLKKNKGWG